MATCCTPTQRSLVVEVTVLRIDGETCERCGKTVESARRAVEALQADLAPAHVRVTLLEHDSDTADKEDSNSVLVNGRSVEEWICAQRVSTDCSSCGEMLGEVVCCGAISIDGAVQESFDAEQIREAAFAALSESHSGRCC